MFVLSRVLILLVFEISEEVLFPVLFLILCLKEYKYHLGTEIKSRGEMLSVWIETREGGYRGTLTMVRL